MNSNSDLNSAIARDVMGWASLGAQLWQDVHGTVYYTGHDPTRVFVPHTVFDPSRDDLHAFWVEEQIERLGKHAVYVDALIGEFAPGQNTLEAKQVGVGAQALVHASPAQRCRAALQVVRAAGDVSGAAAEV